MMRRTKGYTKSGAMLVYSVADSLSPCTYKEQGYPDSDAHALGSVVNFIFSSSPWKRESRTGNSYCVFDHKCAWFLTNIELTT